MKLTSRITISLAVPFYALLITLYIIIGLSINRYLIRDEENILQQKTEVLSSQIKSEIFSFARILLDNSVFIEKNFDDTKRIESVLVEVSSQFPETNGFYVGFNDGRYVDGALWVPDEGWDARTRDWYLSGMANPSSITFCEPYVDDQTGSTCISLSKAIKNQDGKYEAVIAFDYYFYLIEDLINSKLADTQIGMILDDSGKYIYCTNHSIEEKITEIENGRYAVLGKSLLGSGSEFRSFEYEGSAYYFCKSVIPGTNWYLVFGIPRNEVEFTSRTVKIVLLVFFIFLMVFNTVLLYFLMVKALKPLLKTSKAFNDLSGANADLTQRIEQKSQDEIGMVAYGFNNFIEKLQNIVTDIKDSNLTLNDVNDSLQNIIGEASAALTQVGLNIEDVGNEIEKQIETVSSSSSAMESLSEIIDEMTGKVGLQTQSMDAASGVVQQMVGNIGDVSGSIKSIYQIYEDFYQESQSGLEKQKVLDESVKLILDQSKMLQKANTVIANIANQTNLLAMNAAIEAAHAGSSGQGFSVVADEIRKLSETSSVQSKTIAQQLKNIVHSIDDVARTSESSGAIFKSVSDKIQMTNEKISMLNESMEEQQAGTNEILTALATMDNYTRDVISISSTLTELKKSLVGQIKVLVDSTKNMQDRIVEMNSGTQLIGNTEKELASISTKMKASVENIGNQINQFKS